MRRLLWVLLMAGWLAACAPAAEPVESTATPAGEVAAPAATTAPTAGLSTPIPSTADVKATPAGREDNAPVIVFERGGGIAGSYQQWTIYADGTITLADGPEAAAQAAGQVTAGQVTALVGGLEALGFFEMQDTYGANDTCADCFQYVITVTNAGVTKTVTTKDAASDAPPELGQALDLIQALLATTN